MTQVPSEEPVVQETEVPVERPAADPAVLVTPEDSSSKDLSLEWVNVHHPVTDGNATVLYDAYLDTWQALGWEIVPPATEEDVVEETAPEPFTPLQQPPAERSEEQPSPPPVPEVEPSRPRGRGASAEE